MSRCRRKRRLPALSRTVLFGCIFLLSACQSFNTERSEASGPEDVIPAPAEPLRPEQPETLAQVVKALDQGRIEVAETALVAILDQQPASTLALRFLEQIRTDPVELMGAPHDVVVVRSGDSLSEIAERELGDSLQFFALARYNAIAVPSRMPPGIDLKIPRSLRPPAADDPLVEEPPQIVEDSTAEPSAGAGLAVAAQSLYDQGQIAQAIALLTAGARAGSLSADGETLLAVSAVERSKALVEQARRDEALELLNQTSELISAETQPLVQAGRRELQAARLEDEAVRARRAGELGTAYALFEEAAVLDPANEQIRSEADNVRDVLVAQLHDQALIHYRDQQLDEAIQLWQQVEQLAPEFESAQIYLERALALRQRLNEFE